MSNLFCPREILKISKFVFTESVLEKLISHKRLNKLSIFEKHFLSYDYLHSLVKCDLFDKLSSETPPPSNISDFAVNSD